MKMRLKLCALLVVLGFSHNVRGQYQSLLWRVSGKDLKKPSYLYGTMHVSSKLAFQLGDPFYDCMQSSDFVALELEPEAWLDALFQDPMIVDWMNSQSVDEEHYDDYAGDSPLPALEGYWSLGGGLSIGDRVREALLYEPDILNYLMFRYGDNKGAIDFEEDTWLDMHIYQAARKMGLRTIGLETYAQSTEFIRKANLEESLEEDSRQWDQGDIEEYEQLVGQLEPAYRRQDLDLIDSLNRTTSSKAFRKYILVERNKLFVNNLDSMIRSGYSVFAAMGCAHLPGQEGVIQILRQKGYDVVPLSKGSRNAKRRNEIDRRIFERPFTSFTSPDGLITFRVPATIYNAKSNRESTTWLALDIANGANYSITRLKTYSAATGYSTSNIKSIIDSTLFEAIPGDIISNRSISVGRHVGVEIVNRTRRGDYCRRQIIVMPDEIIILQLAATGNKVNEGYGNAFFASLEISKSVAESNTWKSPDRSVAIIFPSRGVCYEAPNGLNRDPDFEVMASDVDRGVYFAAQRHVIEVPDFLEEDSYELRRLMRSFCKDRALEVSSFQLKTHQGLPAMLATMTGNRENGDAKKEQVFAMFVINGLSYLILSTTETDESIRSHWFETLHFDNPTVVELELHRDKDLCFTIELPYKPLEMESEWGTMSDLADLELEPNSPFGTSASVVLSPPGDAQSIQIDFQRFHEFSDGEEKSGFLLDKRKSVEGTDMQILSETVSWNEAGVTIDYLVGDTATSRRFWHRMLLHNKSFYHLSTCYDSVMGISDFMRNAFSSFHTTDTIFPFPHFELRDRAYFDALSSPDSLLRNRALQITGEMDFSVESSPTMRALMKTLPHFEGEDALLIRTVLLFGLSADTSSENIDFITHEFNAYPDSSEYQYELLLALLRMKTSKAWKTYARLVVEEPPIVFDEMGGSGCELLFDSVRLAAPLLPQLMQLLAIDEYEESIYHLMAMAADSGWLPLNAYRYLVPQILVEARNELKRLRSSGQSGYAFNTDALRDYCALLNPVRKEKEVAKFFEKAYSSRNGVILMELARFDCEHKLSPADTVIARLARMNEQVNELYALLWKNGAVNRMPEPYTSRSKLAEIYLTTRYEENEQHIDSVQIVERYETTIRGTKLDVHFYRVFMSESGQWLGHVLAFDNSNPQNAWPLFIESERSVVIDDQEDARKELEEEYLYMEESNREFVNFGSGLNDFSVHWY